MHWGVVDTGGVVLVGLGVLVGGISGSLGGASGILGCCGSLGARGI